jgi:hypothetical protein
MKHHELIAAPGAMGLGVDPAQKIGITLGIKHDHHIAAMNVLGNQDLGKAGLANAGRAENDRMAYPFA